VPESKAPKIAYAVPADAAGMTYAGPNGEARWIDFGTAETYSTNDPDEIAALDDLVENETVAVSGGPNAKTVEADPPSPNKKG
jgi:hypothetical protein